MVARDAAERIIERYRTADPYKLAEEMDIIIHRVDLGTVRGMCYNTRRIRQVFLHYDLPDHLERFVLGLRIEQTGEKVLSESVNLLHDKFG